MAFVVLSLALCANPTRPMAEPHSVSFAQLADAYIRAKTAQGTFSGAVLVARDGHPVLRRGYGLANREIPAPATPDSVFEIGSVTKTFTAVAVARLAAQGKLHLEDSIARYLPAAPAAWRGITIAHLLSHESGIPEYSASSNSFRTLMRTPRTPQEIVGLVDALPLSFAPGAQYRYTNTDYVLLGLIIEQVSGKPYEAFVQDELLTPLHLDRTGFLHAEALIPRRADGYMRRGERWERPFYVDPSMLFAAGSMYSTVDDLLTWDRALHSDRLLPVALQQEVFRDRGHGYGLGFFVDSVGGHRFVGHAGNLPGFVADFERFDDAPLTFILLSNVEAAPVEAMTRDLATIYFERCARSQGHRCVAARSR